MSAQSREEYIRTQRARYRRETRVQKKRILDMGCWLFGMHRKALIRALNHPGPEKRRRRSRRKPEYGPALLEPLKTIWLAAEQPCGKRLKALLPTWLPWYERHFGPLKKALAAQLRAVSASTLDRILRPLRVRPRKGASGTRATRRLQGQIPIRTHFGKVKAPGTFEADTVAHCGDSLAGQFVWTLTLTDIHSGWTENRAVWHKAPKQIVARLRDIEGRLAFDIVAFDSDNGGEFINKILLNYFDQRPKPVPCTRSRPYHKDDQAHVEQKQWTHVRQLLGYERLGKQELVAPIDDLYRNEWRALQNFFLPTTRLISKVRQGGKLTRRHSRPRTPYQRLMASRKLSQEAKTNLRREFESLDPFDLHQRIETKLRAVFALVRQPRKGASNLPVAA